MQGEEVDGDLRCFYFLGGCPQAEACQVAGRGKGRCKAGWAWSVAVAGKSVKSSRQRGRNLLVLGSRKKGSSINKNSRGEEE